jgi:hypothetical protein
VTGDGADTGADADRDSDKDSDRDADTDAAPAGGDDPDAGAADRDDGHLQDVDDGCGCAEVWEHLSEQRQAAGDD